MGLLVVVLGAAGMAWALRREGLRVGAAAAGGAGAVGEVRGLGSIVLRRPGLCSYPPPPTWALLFLQIRISIYIYIYIMNANDICIDLWLI